MRRKNLLLAVCCACAVGLLAVCSANAGIVAQSGFNNASGIVDPSPLTAQDPLDPLTGDLNGQGGTNVGTGWKSPWKKYRTDLFPAGAATVQTTDFTEGDQGVTFNGGSTNATAAAYGRGFTTQSTGTVLCTLDFKMTAAGNCWYVYFSDFGREDLVYTPEDYKGAPGTLKMDGTSIKQYSGGVLVPTKWETGAVSLNTWYTLGLLFDMDARTYQVSLDDIDGEVYNGEYDEARAFNSDVGAMDGFIAICYKNPLYLDNFTISSTLSVIKIPGDTNNDKKVDAADAAKVAAFWGATVAKGEVAKGDFNNDGLVNAADASIMAANWGDHNPPAAAESTAVPEPTTVVLLLGALMGLAVLRRR